MTIGTSDWGKMQVGLMLPAMHPWANNELMLGLAESMNADSVWLPDHIMGTFHPDLWVDTPLSAVGSNPDALMDPFSLAGAVGRMTEKPVGVAVTDGIRRGAADVARTALTLHHLCRGGFNLGVGAGEAESLVPFGYDFRAPVSRTERFLRELRSLIDTGRMPDGGSGVVGVALEDDGKGKPKVWIGAHGPRMLRLTAEYGDGWMPAWPSSAEVYGERRHEIARHCEARGRPEPEAGLLLFFLLGESRDRVFSMMEETPLAKLFALFGDAELWKRHGLEHPLGPESKGFVNVIVHDFDPAMLRELAPTIPVELMDDMMFLGSVDEIVAKLDAYVRAGLQHVVLGNVTGLVGGMPEIEARMPDFFTLCQRLRVM